MKLPPQTKPRPKSIVLAPLKRPEPLKLSVCQAIVGRTPLAEATLGLFHYVLQPAFLDQVFEQARGDSYCKCFDFATMVHILGEAVTSHTSLGAALTARTTRGEPLPASKSAFYGKINRTPLPLSLTLLDSATQRLGELWPKGMSRALPTCFDRLEVLLIDGKKSKNVAKRLKDCRNQPGTVFGAKLLVCLDARTRLVKVAAADPDGECNDNPLVPALLDQLSAARLPTGGRRVRLFVCDAQFCDLVMITRLAQSRALFAVRYHPKNHFHPDPKRPARRWVSAGRSLVEEWGYLGSDQRRRYVRRVTWERGPTHKDLSVVTNITNGRAYPTEALVALYLQRWQIETVFQEVAEVFGLKRLIGSTPEASAFATVVCMLMYNMVQVVKAELAASQRIALDDVSPKKLFRSIHEELMALFVLLTPEQIVATIHAPSTPEEMSQWLRQRLSGCWKAHFRKARNKNPRQYPPKPKRSGAHTSIERLRRQRKETGP